MGIEKIVKPLIIGAAGALLFFGAIKPITQSRKEYKEFDQVYRQALFQYADINKDGLISASENDEFDKKLLSDKGVTLIHGDMPIYKNGIEVPTEVVTEWIRNYKPSE